MLRAKLLFVDREKLGNASRVDPLDEMVAQAEPEIRTRLVEYAKRRDLEHPHWLRGSAPLFTINLDARAAEELSLSRLCSCTVPIAKLTYSNILSVSIAVPSLPAAKLSRSGTGRPFRARPRLLYFVILLRDT